MKWTRCVMPIKEDHVRALYLYKAKLVIVCFFLFFFLCVCPAYLHEGHLVALLCDEIANRAVGEVVQ